MIDVEAEDVGAPPATRGSKGKAPSDTDAPPSKTPHTGTPAQAASVAAYLPRMDAHGKPCHVCQLPPPHWLHLPTDATAMTIAVVKDRVASNNLGVQTPIGIDA